MRGVKSPALRFRNTPMSLRCVRVVISLSVLVLPVVSWSQDTISRKDALAALQKATGFFHDQAAVHGGYVWAYSGDLALSEGEGLTDDRQTVWVQPPGTPSIGEAYLDAYEATGDARYLKMARDTAEALLQGQLQSGGWYYSIVFDPEKRKTQAYRVDPSSPATKQAAKRKNETGPGGWDEWKQRKNKGNMTVLDDNTTQSALAFLIRLDRATDFKDKPIHEAAEYALQSLLAAQYPIGAWSHYYDSLPSRQPSVDHYPVVQASFPETWSRTWTKDWTGCYRLNDRITLDVISTLLDAYHTYGDARYLAAAERGGDFLLRAQLPDPQPAWAQQYNRQMQPVWDRKFEPPAITGSESQSVLETLLLLYRETGDKKYLEPIPRAIAYLRICELPGGKLARFYELQTNRPIYFTRQYELTYDHRNVPTHYGFTVGSKLDAIERQYQKLVASGPPKTKPTSTRKRPSPPSKELSQEVAEIIKAMDDRGAWVEQGTLDQHDRKPESGIIDSRTFIANVQTLCRFLEATRE
jgi:hypothetical protein